MRNISCVFLLFRYPQCASNIELWTNQYTDPEFLGTPRLLRTSQVRRECVVNIPSPDVWPQVEAIAPLTGRNPVPEHKGGRFSFEKDKFAASSLTAVWSEIISAPRVRECPVKTRSD